MNYGCEIWGFHQAPNIERVQLSFYKRILGVKKSTQNDFIYGLLGKVPMLIHRHFRIIKYWIKIISGQKSLYVNTLYMSSLANVDKKNSNNWAYNVKQLLCSTGFGDVWRDQGVVDPEGFCSAFKLRLWDIFRQDWSSRLSNSSRARFFREVNPNHKFNNILDIVNTPSHRTALCRLITSSHYLGIEKGRWTRPVIPTENRLCTVCNKLDDEYHFLLECSSYIELRTKFIPKKFYKRPSMYKCIQLLTSDHKKTLRNISKFVFMASNSSI